MPIGGRAIASGSQGCIFRPKLKVENVGGRGIATNSTVPNANGIVRISKVFVDKDVFDKECMILTKVNSITGGVGTIDIEESAIINTIRELNSEIPESLTASNGCGRIMPNLRAGNPVYVFHQRSITGDIFEHGEPRPLRFFKSAFDALTKLLMRNIVHLDLAKRNIFFDEGGALIGDFGYGIDMTMSDDEFDKSLDVYYTSHCYFESLHLASTRINDTLKERNTLTAEATLALYIYKRFHEREVFIDIIDNDKSLRDWIRRKTGWFADQRLSVYFNEVRYYAVAEQMRSVDKNTIREILKRELRQGDIKIFLMSIFSVIRFADEEQQTSYFRAIREGDYDIFYRLLGEEPSEEIQRNITTLKNEGLFLPLSPAGGGAKAFSRRKRVRIQNRRRRNKTIKL